VRNLSTAHRRRWALAVSLVTFGLAATLLPAAGSAAEGSNWTSAGGNRQNTRFQESEHTLSAANVGGLGVKWTFLTAGDVSATPAVDETTVYVPDWAGWLYAVDKQTGLLKWKSSIPLASGSAFDKARATPAVTEDKVIVGTQGGIFFGGGPGGKVLAFNKFTGALVWSTRLDTHPAAIITQSATVFDGRVYVGTASQEEALAALVPGYVLSFRGKMAALDLGTGAILWETSMAPPGYTGNAVWGSSPAIDPKRGQVYIATGNNYSVPPDVLACVAAAPPGAARSACLPADDYFDNILALDLKTGAIRWATRAIDYDAWTVDCIPFFGDGDLCPQPAGPDYDFGQAPALYSTKDGKGKTIERVGAGQKSGQYWSLDPDTGAPQWPVPTQAGPGGTAGGLQWGSAVDKTRVYTANANSNSIPWTLFGGGPTVTSGVWSGINSATGAMIWQHTPSSGGGTSGPVTTANGVVYGCSLDALGHMYALDAATGAELWKFASGGSCLSGAAISDGTLYWGSGYSNFGFGTPNNKLYAFSLQ
jgi:polyvinyl alcohol dehydrogenase (cytochrome)